MTTWTRVEAGGFSYMERFCGDLAALPHGTVYRTVREEWVDDPGPSEHNPEGLPERLVHEVEFLPGLASEPVR